MVKSTKPPTTRSRTRSPKRKGIEGLPDVSVLAQYSPDDEQAAHPAWIKADFSDYILAHDAHRSTSVREFTHQGHQIKITTTYKVEVDGCEIDAHLFVDEDGRVHTHATPFVTYASAVGLMSAVIDAYPSAFEDLAAQEPAHDHGGARKARKGKTR